MRIGNRTRTWRRLRNGKELFILSFPALVFIFLFSYYPLYGILIPFKDMNFQLGLLESPWVGLRNFAYLFNSNDALRITRNTVFLNTLFIGSSTALAVLFALLLQPLRNRQVKFYQTLLFIPAHRVVVWVNF